MGKKTIPSKIDKFLGLNESTNGSLNLEFGEASQMTNWKITDDMKLKKVEGYAQLFASIAANKSIRGMFQFSISGTEYIVFACNGHIYKLNVDNTYTDLGTLTDDVTTFFVFNNVLYIQNGHEYKKWTGTGSIATVTGYRPRVAINAPPGGGGTAYEEINLLNGLKEITFTPDSGVSTQYKLSTTAITSVDYVYKNEVLQTAGTHYTADATDLANGRFTWTTSPAGNIVGSIRVGFTQGTTTGAIEAQYYNMFFNADGTNDNRVFFWGKDNTCYYSGLALTIPSAEYFPANSYFQTDSNGYKVTDVVRQYDRQVVFTNKPEAYFTTNNTITADNGLDVSTFSISRLNSSKGMVAPNQTRIVNNNPYTLTEGVYEWVATNVRDERNAVYKSARVQPSLDALSLKDAITCDWEHEYEYWIAVGKTVLVYQYHVNTWHKLSLNDNVKCLMPIGDKLYFGTDQGQIMEFSEDYLTFNGVTIAAEWYMGFFSASVEYLRKFTNMTYISLNPESKSWVDVYWQNNLNETIQGPINTFYSNLDFDNIDFDDWSFLGNYNPQPFKVRTKSKKWVYFRLILKSSKAQYRATVINVTLIDKVGGFSK